MNLFARHFYGSPAWLLRLICTYWPEGWSRWLRALAYLLRALWITPGAWAERLFYSRQIREQVISSPPLFILGHYRSGTTLLFKLLCRHPGWSYPDGMDLLFPYTPPALSRLIRPFLGQLVRFLQINNPFYYRYFFRLEDPIEEELHFAFSIAPCSAYWGMVFARQAGLFFDSTIRFRTEKAKQEWQSAFLYGLQRLSWRKKGKRLVLKSPPATARVRALLELFPDARFIYLTRHPGEIFQSMERLVRDVLIKNYSLHRLNAAEIREFVIAHYLLLYKQFQKEKGLIPKGHLLELRYDEVVQEPFVTAKRIFDELALDGWEQFVPALQLAIRGESSYRPHPETVKPETLALVQQYWPESWAAWNKASPASTPGHADHA